MPTTTGSDTITLSEGPKVKVNSDASANWNNQSFDGLAGFDTLIVDESSTKTSYFSFSLSHDGIVTFTAASGGNSPTVSFVNMEQIQFWDITLDLGSAGDDMITGSSFGTTLYGFDGNDTIDGGGGADKMLGGAGNDTYIVDGNSDIVTELSGEGKDTIEASVNYSLVDTDGAGSNGGNVENLTLTGVAAINGTGNSLNNTLKGNTASNTLDGGDGNDVLNGGKGVDIMIGGAGNDKYTVDETTETVTELLGGGFDIVRSTTDFKLGANVEKLVLLGTGNFFAKGNGLNNFLVGNDGKNKMTGGDGRDTLIGNGGADKFDFNNVTESAVGSKHDVIKDFEQSLDRVDLKNIDADTTVAKNQAFTLLTVDGSSFSGQAGELRYETSGGNTMIEGDTNGDSIADFQIELIGSYALTVDDFIL